MPASSCPPRLMTDLRPGGCRRTVRLFGAAPGGLSESPPRVRLCELDVFGAECQAASGCRAARCRRIDRQQTPCPSRAGRRSRPNPGRTGRPLKNTNVMVEALGDEVKRTVRERWTVQTNRPRRESRWQPARGAVRRLSERWASNTFFFFFLTEYCSLLCTK